MASIAWIMNDNKISYMGWLDDRTIGEKLHPYLHGVRPNDKGTKLVQ